MDYVSFEVIRREIRAMKKMIENQENGLTNVSQDILNAHLMVCLSRVEREVSKKDGAAIIVD